MSWRDILGITRWAETADTHNSQNTQKPTERADCADIADSAFRKSEQENSKLLEALADASRSLDITPVEVKEALSREDIDDWRKGKISAEMLVAFARTLTHRRQMDKGERPDHFTEQAYCQHCGPIWLWTAGQFQGCPWCWNRTTNRPIPRPHSVRCSDCAHFENIDHPHLGHCTAHETENLAGLWDTDWRYCERYLPSPRQTDSKRSQVISSEPPS